TRRPSALEARHREGRTDPLDAPCLWDLLVDRSRFLQSGVTGRRQLLCCQTQKVTPRGVDANVAAQDERNDGRSRLVVVGLVAVRIDLLIGVTVSGRHALVHKHFGAFQRAGPVGVLLRVLVLACTVVRVTRLLAGAFTRRAVLVRGHRTGVAAVLVLSFALLALLR